MVLNSNIKPCNTISDIKNRIKTINKHYSKAKTIRKTSNFN